MLTCLIESMKNDSPLVAGKDGYRISKLWHAVLDETPLALQWAPSLHALAAAPAEGSIVLFDAATGRPARTWLGIRGGNFSLQWHPSKALLAIGGAQGSLRLFDAFSDHPAAEACLGKGFVERLGWSQVADAAPRPLAAACGRMVHLRSETLDPLREWHSHGTVLDLDWNPLMEIFVTTHRSGLQMWLPSEERNPVDIDYPGAVLTVRWSPCGWHFAVGNHDATASIINTKNMGCLRLGGFGGKVSRLAWEPGSRTLAGAGDCIISCWDLTGPPGENSRALPMEGHIGPIAGMEWQPRGNLLASAAADACLLLWKPDSEILPILFQSLSAPASQLAWSADGRHLAVATCDARVAVFEIQTP
jgi:WD40 repeat protein